MPGFLPDPLAMEVLWQGDSQHYRLRLTLPDGSSETGLLDLDALTARLQALPTDGTAGQPQDYGQALYSALFPATLANQYYAALKAARERGIRLELHLDESHPELHRIPWERLYQQQGSQWSPLAASPQVVFSRYLQTGQPWALPLPAGPLKILIVISSPFPSGNPLFVDANIERQNVVEVLNSFSDQIEYDFLQGQVSAQQLVDRLNQGTGVDILYYIGHGDWHADEQTGYLILSKQYEDGSIGPAGVSAAELAQILAACPHLPQLIFLGACETGQQSTQDAFAGVGPQLVLAGCPAVICMQEKVEKAVASQFARQFYTNLLDSGCVDLAVNRARVGLLENQYAQWAVPVLYMRLEDGILFNPGDRFRPAQRQPYKFLASYQRQDQDLFRGRKNKISEVYQHICSSPVTVVYGEGGVGLTSLMEAGVRPLLEAERWLVASISDYSDLPGEFRVQLRRNGHPWFLPVAGDASLPELLRAASAGGFDHLCLILDQFETVFSLAEADQVAVQQALAASVQQLGEQLKLALVVNKDSLGKLARFQSLLDQAGAWIEVLPLEVQDAVDAILDPLDVLGWPVTLNPSLAREQIAPDLGNLYEENSGEGEGKTWVDPGQLQITCTWLYQKARERRPPMIDESLYLKEAGGADGILVRYMEDELQTHFADQYELARQILVAMAAPDREHWVAPNELNLTSSTPSSDGPASPVSTASIILILDRLTRAELLVRRQVDGHTVYAFANQTVAQEAVRLGGQAIEQSYNAGDELERVWRLWLASLAHAVPGSNSPDQSLATRQQLRALAQQAQYLDSRPVKILLLLRSAVLRGEPTEVWLDWLRKNEPQSGLIQSLEAPDAAGMTAAAKGAGRELAGRLLGLGDPDLPKKPENTDDYGEVAWAAVSSSDPVNRHTSALALTVLPNGLRESILHVQRASGDIRVTRKRFFRWVELLGTLADSGPEMNKAVHEELTRHSTASRWGVTLWRIFRRIGLDRHWIAWMALGSGIGAGLGLGLERLVIGSLAQSHLGTIFFALFSYWGLLLAGLTGFSMALASSLRLDKREPAKKKAFSSQVGLEILLGTLGFGIANFLVAVLNGIVISKAPLVIPMGFIAGFVFSAVLAGQSREHHRRKAWYWLVRAGIAALGFALIQWIFVANPTLGSGISISLSGGFIQVDYEYFAWEGWQAYIATHANWFNLLSVIEAGLAGLGMTAGALAGRELISTWYLRWKEFIDRTGD